MASPASDYDSSNGDAVSRSEKGEARYVVVSESDESGGKAPRETRSDSVIEADKAAYEWKQKALMERLDFGEQVDSHGDAVDSRAANIPCGSADLPEQSGPALITVAICRITESLPWAEMNRCDDSRVIHTVDWHLQTIIDQQFDYDGVKFEAEFSIDKIILDGKPAGGACAETVYVQPQEDDAELIGLWDKGPAEIDEILKNIVKRHAEGKWDAIVIHASW